MQYTINQLRDELFKTVYDVYAIFQNFFGEDKTDLQLLPTDFDIANELAVFDISETEQEGIYEISDSQKAVIKDNFSDTRPAIIVWWPEVTITNENYRSVIIYDLYAKIEILPNGTIPAENRGFQLNKATYTGKQFTSGYQHSHTPSRRYRNRDEVVAKWQNPCLGTSPINATINSLKIEYDEMTWMLFCEEMARSVTVESLRGVPYIKLETIGGSQKDTTLEGFIKTGYAYINKDLSINEFGSFKEHVKDFTLFYLQNGHLFLNYCDGQFIPGMPFYNYLIDISNNFIAWVNKHCTKEQLTDFMNYKVFYSRIIKEGTFMLPATATEEEIHRYSGMHMLTFKGQDIKLSIIPDTDNEDTITILLDPWISIYILQKILNIINYRFTNGHTTNTAESSGTSGNPAPTYQTVIYL